MLDTTEMYNFLEDRWIPGPVLPLTFSKHQMVSVSNTTVLLIGGIQASKASSQVWIYDFEDDSLKETGSLNLIRVEQSCSQLPTSGFDEDNEFFETRLIGCVGGYSNEMYVEFGEHQLRNMEIYDPTIQTWTLTKHFMPVYEEFILWGASMAMLENTVVISGGFTPYRGVTDLMLEYHPTFGFRLLPRQLETPR